PDALPTSARKNETVFTGLLLGERGCVVMLQQSNRGSWWVLTFTLFLTASAYGQAQGTDWKTVEEAMGRPGQAQPGDVIRFGMPRKDQHVMVRNVAVKTGLALGSWEDS